MLVSAVLVVREFKTNKHAFYVRYYQILDSTQGRPFGLYMHGNQGTEGAVRAVDSIISGLGWTQAAEYVIVSGAPGKDDARSVLGVGCDVGRGLDGGVNECSAEHS